MRNGIDISGVSEIVHEIQEDPKQAQFCYAACAKWSQGAGVLASVRPALIGLLKAPRQFEIPVLPSPVVRGATMLPPSTAEELAVTALAGCFLASSTSGFTSRSTLIEKLSMDVTVLFSNDATSQTMIEYAIHSRNNKGVQETAEVIETVQGFSPNHQTFLTPLSVTAQIGNNQRRYSNIENVSLAVEGTNVKPNISVNCEWLYGTQLESRIITGENVKILPIDQPKQLAGVDSGPNPQEYLLMAMAADVLQHIATHPATVESEIKHIKINSAGYVDIRGMLHVDDIPAHMQELNLIVDIDGDHSLSDDVIDEIVDEAIQKSVVIQLVRTAVLFNVTFN